MILHGAIDIHVHCSPDAIPRAEHAYDVVAAAAQAGMAGLVLKDHCTSTAGICDVLNRIQNHVRCVGAIALNEPVGGLNPLAVDAALAAGVRMVFMPTYCAHFHLEQLGARALPAGLPFPTLPYTGLHVLDSTGRIKDDVLKMCRSIASADAVLATGHLGPKEALTLLAAARKVGVRRMVVTHASERVPGFSIAEQRAAIELGAWIEHSFLPMTPCGGGSLSAQALHDQLRTIGIERMILSSDFGQVANGPVVAGFLHHLEAMVAVGFSVDEIRTMVVNNPHRLLFGEPT